jgi:tryptophanyl-tRNA synthetase
LFQLYQAFATPEETAAFAQAYADGIGWGDAKQQLFDRVERDIAPLRERYETLIAKPADIEAILRDGAERLRAKYATPFLRELRHAVGLRDLSAVASVAVQATAKAALPVFKQYREADGRFYFKLSDAQGNVLVQSQGFDSPRDAGQLVAVLKNAEAADQLQSTELLLKVSTDEVLAALAALREASAQA